MKEYELKEIIQTLQKVNATVSKMIEDFDKMKPELEPRIIEIKPKFFCKKCASSSGNYQLKHIRTKTFEDRILETYECPSCHYLLVIEHIGFSINDYRNNHRCNHRKEIGK